MKTATHQITKSDFEDPTIKCGTASLGRAAQIDLCVEKPNADPIQVNLTQRVVIGRAEESCSEIDIDVCAYGAVQKGVSRRHAALDVVNKTLMVSDLNSTNGTFINGQKIPPGHRRVVRDGDELRLGELLIHVFYSRPNPQR